MAAHRFAIIIALAAGCALFAGCSERSSDEGALPSAPAEAQIFYLPEGLREISGLAAASETSVYAHNDEYGIIYEMNVTDGAVLKAFALGRPTVREDFEGVAVMGERIYLLTSDGRIFEAPIGVHGERVLFNVYDTGLADKCEFEGLAPGPAQGEFLLLCKRSAPELPARAVNIYQWDLSDRVAPAALWRSIPLEILLTENEARVFRPSAIERRASGALIIVSAANAVMVEITGDGAFVHKRTLAPSAHPQAEGVALLPDGRVVIADEGSRRQPGRITVYRGIEP